jgi:hypothetical protein
MKSSKIKIIALVLTILLMSVLIFSCGGKDAGNTDNDDKIPANDGGNADNSGQEETPAAEDSKNSVGARPDYDLPEQNFNGYNFRILSRSETANLHWWNHDISAEEITGDPINDAIFDRNQKVEERYNITIKNIPDNGVGAKASKSIKAGSDDYDLIVIGLRDGQENLMTAGYLMDFHNIPNIDLTKPWWDQKAVEQLSIYGKLFATSCDLTVRDKDAIIILMFSKTLAQNYDVGNLYELVSTGKWTLDKMSEMVRMTAKDLNGDGKMDLDDQYGLFSQYRHTQYLIN